MKTFYIAGSDQEAAKKVRDALVRCGFACTTEWMESTDFRKPRTDERNREIALMDLASVMRADFFVALSSKPGKGGRHVELGYALACAKPVFLIGPKENVFHWHPSVEQFNDIHQLVHHLAAEETHQGKPADGH